MFKALVVSDNLNTTYLLENELSMAGWASNSISIPEMALHRLVSISHYQCVILVIDMEFRKRLGNVIHEMEDIIRNGACNAALYLIFEGDYDPYFAPWLEHTRRLFKLAARQHTLKTSVEEIIRLESGETSANAFVSPMDSV
jgi:hypothetical protein